MTRHVQASEATESESRAQMTVLLTAPEAHFEIVLWSDV